MTAIPSSRARASFSSRMGKAPSRFKAIAKLGQEIVRDLGIEKSVDTTGRWMSHYVARLILEAEAASGKRKVIAELKASKAILTLWKHRASLPEGARPFKEWGIVLKTLREMHASSRKSRYFSVDFGSSDELEKHPESAGWLSLAEGLDYTARILTLYCLSRACKGFRTKTTKWLTLAHGLSMDHDMEKEVLLTILKSDGFGDEEAIKWRLVSLRDKEKRLNGFMKLAGDLALAIKNDIAHLDEQPPVSKVDISSLKRKAAVRRGRK